MFGSKKGKSNNTWVVVAIIAALFLLPQSPLFLGSILSGDRTFSWQGLNWKYNSVNPAGGDAADPLVPTISSQALILSVSCNHPNSCAGWFRHDFSLSQFSELKFRVVANTAAHIGGNSMSGSASFGVSIGDKPIAGVSSSAEERGGTNIQSDSDRLETAFSLLKQLDGSWAVYISGTRAFNITDINPSILFNIGATGSQSGAGGSVSTEIFMDVTTQQQVTNKALCEFTQGTYYDAINECICPPSSKGFVADKGCNYDCLPNEVKLTDNSCKKLVRTCIDNNLNNVCDADDPVVWKDPELNIPICADRDNNRICDDVQSLFCKDSNSNNICDSDEEKWLATYCLDKNSNGVCDGIESGTIACPNTYAPVCDSATNITFPNSCFASGFGISPTQGACKVPPIIIRLDCTTGAFPIPSGYLCQPETGFLYRIDKIYTNITIDCRSLPQTEGYTCKNLGEQWVFVRTELVNIDCYSVGCPSGSQCQGGLCTKETTLKCPSSIDCVAKYGSGSACDEETGLCVLKQYLVQDCKVLGCPSGNKCVTQNNSNVCVKAEAVTVAAIQKAQQGGIFGTPIKLNTTAIVALLVGVAGLVLLAKMKKP